MVIFTSEPMEKLCMKCARRFINAREEVIEDFTSTGKPDNLTIRLCPYCGSSDWEIVNDRSKQLL